MNGKIYLMVCIVIAVTGIELDVMNLYITYDDKMLLSVSYFTLRLYRYFPHIFDT